MEEKQREEPQEKRCVAFVDAHSLHRAVQASFTASWPDFHPIKLAELVCEQQGWNLVETRLYVLMPTEVQSRHWHNFWNRKCKEHSKEGVKVQQFMYRDAPHVCPVYNDQSQMTGFEVKRAFGHEEVSVSIALDLMQRYYDDAYDVALIFSRDSSLTQAIQRLRKEAFEDNAWIKFASAVPYAGGQHGFRGVRETDWLHIDRETYDACRDLTDYRKPRALM